MKSELRGPEMNEADHLMKSGKSDTARYTTLNGSTRNCEQNHPDELNKKENKNFSPVPKTDLGFRLHLA